MLLIKMQIENVIIDLGYPLSVRLVVRVFGDFII